MGPLPTRGPELALVLVSVGPDPAGSYQKDLGSVPGVSTSLTPPPDSRAYEWPPVSWALALQPHHF